MAVIQVSATEARLATALIAIEEERRQCERERIAYEEGRAAYEAATRYFKEHCTCELKSCLEKHTD